MSCSLCGPSCYCSPDEEQKDPILRVLAAHMHKDPTAKAAFDAFAGDVPCRASIAKVLDFLFRDRGRLIAEATRAAMNQPPLPVMLATSKKESI